MLLFKSAADLSKVDSHKPVYPILEDLVQRLIIDFDNEGYNYDPEAHGFIALIEKDDLERVLEEIWPDPDGWTLLDIPWEGVLLEDGYYKAIFLANNDFGIVFLIEDTPWLNGELRQVLNAHIDYP